MAAIHTGRVIVGGLIAGVVFSVLDMVTNTVILADEMSANLTRLNLNPADMQRASVAVAWVLADFLLGFLIVWTYAAIRPRFGPGPRTAMLAGFVIFAGVTFVLFGFTAMGVFTSSLFVKSAIAALVTTLVGSVAGGWAYREE